MAIAYTAYGDESDPGPFPIPATAPMEGGPDYVPPAERIATFDNDGTLWCEKPMPIELGFILMRLAEMAEADESLGEKQPRKAAREQDYHWLGDVISSDVSLGQPIWQGSGQINFQDASVARGKPWAPVSSAAEGRHGAL